MADGNLSSWSPFRQAYGFLNAGIHHGPILAEAKIKWKLLAPADYSIF
jgi:hypothetical protein